MRIKFEGVAMLYIVSSTEPTQNDDGSWNYTAMPDYGDVVYNLPWEKRPIIGIRHLMPPEPVEETEHAPRKAKKAKADAPVSLIDKLRNTAETMYPDNKRAQLAWVQMNADRLGLSK